MKTKILFIMNRLGVGGVEKMLLTTLDNLDYNKYDVWLLLWDNTGEWHNLINSNVKVICIAKKGSTTIKMRIFRMMPKLYKRWIIKEKFDIEIVYRYDIWHTYAGFCSAKKIFAIVHGDLFYQDYYKEFLHKGKGKLIKKLISKELNSATKILCVSENSRESFEQYWKVCNTEILFNCIDTEKIIQESYEEIDMKDEFICTVSRLDMKKNVSDIIKAFSLLAVNYSKLKMLIIGDGDQRSYLESLVQELNLQDKVVFLGNQTNPYKYVARAKAFAFASLEEAFGLAVLEPAILRVPIVSYNVRGITSIMSDSMQIVDCNSNSLYLGLLKILSECNYTAEHIDKAYHKALCFDVHNYIEKLDNILTVEGEL